MPKPVKTKADFVKRYAAGEFGNASPTWGSIGEWLAAEYQDKQLYHVRNRVKGGQTWYNVEHIRLPSVWTQASIIYGEQNLYISAMAPTERTLIQGEVREGVWGLELFCSRVAKPMREALREQSQYIQGLEAAVLLQLYMDLRSWEWLEHLLNTYEDHVVEFSTYGVEWGTVRDYNTVFWEVRLY